MHIAYTFFKYNRKIIHKAKLTKDVAETVWNGKIVYKDCEM